MQGRATSVDALIEIVDYRYRDRKYAAWKETLRLREGQNPQVLVYAETLQADTITTDVRDMSLALTSRRMR